MKDIRRHFPDCEGWQATLLEAFPGYDQILRLERSTGQNFESVVLGVSFTKSVPASLIEKIHAVPVSTLPRYSIRERRAVLVPKACDTSAVGSDVEIFHMKNFALDGKNLVWEKHPSYRIARIRNAVSPAV